MASRVYNAAETKADLYARITTNGETMILLAEATYGDLPYSVWQYDENSSATDNFAGGVIKPTLQTGNGRWLRRGYYGAPTGTLYMWGTTTAPAGYLLCNGNAVSRSTYSDLFSAIGTIFGAGDGSTTFNVPDFRQRFPLGVATTGTGSTLAASGGQIDHTHTITHTHDIDPPNTTSGAPSDAVNNVSLVGVGSAASATHTHDINIATFTSGASSAANSGANNPPFLAINFIIKA